MRNVRTRRPALGLLTALFFATAVSGTSAPASALTIEARGSTVDARGRLVLLVGRPVVLRAVGASEEGPYRWSLSSEGGGAAVLGEDAELRRRLSAGVYEVTLEDGAETARAVLVVRRTPVVVVGGWAGGLDREALADLATDYDEGYREDVLDPLAGETLTPNAWLDVFGRRSLRSGYAALVAEVIAETRYRTGAPEVDVVAFGAAGLAVRWLASNQWPSGIRRIVSVGTPGHGTDLASPSFGSFENRAGLLAGKKLADVLGGLGPKDGSELLEMSDRLVGHLPAGVEPERAAASLVALRNPELVPHSSFLAALNEHRGMLPTRGERPAWALPELVLAGSWGSTATHVDVPVPGVEVSVAVPRLAAGDRVTAAEGAGWGGGAVVDGRLSYLDLKLGDPEVESAILGFLRSPRPDPPPPPPPARAPTGWAAQILFAAGKGFYPPYPHKYDFAVEASARSLVLTFSSPAKLSLLASYRTRRGLQRIFANSPGVETVTGVGMAELNVERPRPGNWTVEVEGEKGGAYSVAGTYETKTYVGAGVSASSVLPGEPVTVYGYAVQPDRDPDLPLPFEVTAKVWLGAQSVDVPLYDDGDHGDGEAEDGLYAGEFLSTQEPGTYLVTVEGVLLEGRQQLRRWAYERFTVESLAELTLGNRILLCDASPRPWEPFGVAVVVQNWGHTDAAGAVVELLEELPGRRARLLSRSVVEVEAGGGSAVARFFVELPPGEHRLRARASAVDGPLESNYRNNVARLTVALDGPEDPPSAAVSGAGLEILSPPAGARVGERAVVTVHATIPELESVEVTFDGRPAGSCAAGGRMELYCHVPLVASRVRGKKLRVVAEARSAGGGTVRREATYTLDRKAPKLRVGEGHLDEAKRLHLSYDVRGRKDAGEVLAIARGATARGADGEIEIKAAPDTKLFLYAADRACNLDSATVVVPRPPAVVLKSGFEAGLRGWRVTGKQPSDG